MKRMDSYPLCGGMQMTPQQGIVFSRSGCRKASMYVPGLCAVKQCTRGTGELTLLNLFSNCEGARLGCPHRFVVSLRSVLSLRQWVWIPIQRGV